MSEHSSAVNRHLLLCLARVPVEPGLGYAVFAYVGDQGVMCSLGPAALAGRPYKEAIGLRVNREWRRRLLAPVVDSYIRRGGTMPKNAGQETSAGKKQDKASSASRSKGGVLMSCIAV